MARSGAPRLSTLQARLAKLDELVSAHEQQLAEYGGANFESGLPSPENWPAFAALTKIRSGDEEGGKVMSFVPYAFQDDLISRIHNSINTLILKSRQLGISEAVSSYLLCRALNEPGFTAVIISKTQKDSSDLAERVKYMAQSITCVELTWTSASSTKLSWKGRGTLHFLPATEKAGRGIPACSVLFLDEAAFNEYIKGIYQGAAPSLSKLGPAGKIIVNSTPNLEADWYGGLWNEDLPTGWYDNYVKTRKFAEFQSLLDNIPGSWRRVVLHYSMHPEYGKDPEWAEKYRKQQKFTMLQWNSEFELMFGSTTQTIYPAQLIAAATKHYEYLECGEVGRTYVLGVDPNGTGDDYFTAVMLDVTKRPVRTVALYREHQKSTPYSLRHIKDMINLFCPAGIRVERNSMGVIVAEALQADNQGYNVDTIYMNQTNKNVLTDRVLYLLEQHELEFPDGIIPKELAAFRRTESGRREAATGHDDCVMALALACDMVPGLPDLAAFLRAA